MYIKQLSVFVENREGRLMEVLNIIKENKINIVSMSLADTSDYGMLRLIVSDPEKAVNALKQAGLSAHITNVLAVRMSHKVGELGKHLEILCSEGINIEYMYALATGVNDASIVIKPSNLEKAFKLLEENNVNMLSDKDIEQII